ncbi:uncharacterized protein CEXT_627421 [Caerostris extrusa]|uniref:Transposase IS30-like HTH domain-containing protein n=1 Tax=Caerostris extrusa TaxID=172846 RepID=A0AAV4XEZ9_CAEEX|nr:uncharacterized protein CEXT_627421 [Caerostris extrusa]
MDLKGKEITPKERKIIIKLRNEGKNSFREIGKIVGRTHSSIQRVINNYTSSKSIISKPRSGRPSKLTAREKRYAFKSRVIITEWNNISSEETSKLVHSMPKRLTEVLRRRRLIECISSQQAFNSLKLQNKSNFSGQQLKIINIQIKQDCAELKRRQF